MAILHSASLTPSKKELLSEYLTGARALSTAAAADIELLGAYRFDDPAGQVGIECHLLGSPGEATLHLPVMYRGTPLADHDDVFIGIIEHSVLGRRWVYECCSDPIFVGELVRTMFKGGTQVELFVETDEGRVSLAPTATVRGSGRPDAAIPALSGISVERSAESSVITAGSLDIVVRHRLNGEVPEAAVRLDGSWAEEKRLLAYVR